jgi:diadenylate cyclase
MTELLEAFRWVDLLDILILYYILYRSLLILRGTRAFQVLFGLILITFLYFLSEWLDLLTINWILKELFGYLILAIVIIFQSDIRRGLARMGVPFMGAVQKQEEVQLFEEIARACFRLSGRGEGALIAVERDADLLSIVGEGTPVDGRVSADLLVSVFGKQSPIHDGAVIIRAGRVEAAGCFLPLSQNPDLDRYMGTRHRAALGLTEETDALVFLVSEERQTVSLVFEGRVTTVADTDALRLAVNAATRKKDEEDEEEEAEEPATHPSIEIAALGSQSSFTGESGEEVRELTVEEEER